MRVRRLTREERRSLTKGRILEAARRLFFRHGFHATSLEQIAAEAGFTKGAVFSNFASKADLFLALLDLRIAERTEELDGALAAPEPTLEREVRRAARAYMETAHRPANWSLLVTEFWAHASRNPELRRELAIRHDRVLGALAERMESTAARLGLRLALPARQLARAAWCGAQGVVLEQFIAGEAASDELVQIMWEALFKQFGVPAVLPGKEETG